MNRTVLKLYAVLMTTLLNTGMLKKILVPSATETSKTLQWSVKNVHTHCAAIVSKRSVDRLNLKQKVNETAIIKS